jgi:RibD C-terminal domain
VFVLTHHPREPLTMQGGTTFTFVIDGIHSALDQARKAAGDRDVAIAGGAATINQYLAAGLIDELHTHIAPASYGHSRSRRKATSNRRHDEALVDTVRTSPPGHGHMIPTPGKRKVAARGAMNGTGRRYVLLSSGPSRRGGRWRWIL